MNHYFSGFNTKEITLHADETVKENSAVVFADDNTVKAAAAGEIPCGICTKIRNGLASVVFAGHVTVPFGGSAPALGWQKLSADGNGGVKADENGKQWLVVYVNDADKTVDIIM